MKEIKKYDMDKLLKNGILKNTRRGVVDRRGNIVGYSLTKNKRYIEDKYANLAERM